MQPVLLEPLISALSIETEFFGSNISAPYEIIEICDFECRHSAALQPVLKKLRAALGDSASWISIPFPSGNFKAKQTYGKAYCAAIKQNKAEQFKDTLFSCKPWLRSRNREDDAGWALANVFKAADVCSLNIDIFEKDLYSDEIDNLYLRILMGVGKVRVWITPTLFINGYRIESALRCDAYREALRKIGPRKAGR